MNHLNRCKTSTSVILVIVLFFAILSAGGAGGTDETGTNKETHQLSVTVISMGTLSDVPANHFLSMASG